MYSTGLFYETSPFGETLRGSFGDWFKKNWKWIVAIGSVLAYIFIPAVAGIVKAGALLIAGNVCKALGKTKDFTMTLLKSGAVNLYPKRDGSIGWTYEGKFGEVDLTVEETQEKKIINEKKKCYIANATYQKNSVPITFYVIKKTLPKRIVSCYYKSSPFLIKVLPKSFRLATLEFVRVFF